MTLHSRHGRHHRDHVKGVPATSSSAFRNLVNDRYPDWVLDAQLIPPITSST